MASYDQWLRHEYPGGTAPFRIAETMGPQPVAHDSLDAVRMMWRRTPEAQYPDGYLGTVRTRTEDRLLDGLKRRQINRPNNRGIHKGERIDKHDYFWPPEFNLWTGLKVEATGMRFAPPGLGEQLEYERYPTDRNKMGPRSVPVGGGPRSNAIPASGVVPSRLPVLRGQAPPYATGVRGNPGMAVPYPGR